MVLFDKATYDKLLKEVLTDTHERGVLPKLGFSWSIITVLFFQVPTYKLITPAIVSERLKVRGSLARKALEELLQKGLIRQVVQHHAQTIYTRVTKEGDEENE